MVAEATPLSRKGSVRKLFGVVPTSTTGTTGTSSITAKDSFLEYLQGGFQG